jgi:hypothetical protein
MILYLKDHTNSIKKLLEIIYSFGKVAGCKIHIQKSVAFLYTNNEQIEKEIRETIPFTKSLLQKIFNKGNEKAIKLKV